MYVWEKHNRRDRRERKHEQFKPYLGLREIKLRRKEAKESEQEEEEVRRMMELRELDTATKEVTPIIEKYIMTKWGKRELRAVAKEMRRLKDEYNKLHPAAAEEARLRELAALEAEENGTEEEQMLQELEKKEKVRSIFEMFDGDGSDSMDADELKELMSELLLPTSDEEVAKYMEEMDEDGSGDIDFEEFYNWYDENHEKLTKGRGFKIVQLALGNALNKGLGLADLAEARRIIIAHAQFETKEHALHNFRLFRPPNYEALARSPFYEPPETDDQREKRKQRFEAITNLLYAQGYEARKMRLERLGFSPLLYVPRITLDDLPVNDTPSLAPSVGDGGTRRRAKQWANGQSVEGLDPSRGKRPGVKTLMLRSIRSPLATSWNMTRTVHPTFSMVKVSEMGGSSGSGVSGGEAGSGVGADGVVMVRKGKRQRAAPAVTMPLLDKPLAARMLQREQQNNARLKRTDLQMYPPHSLMLSTVEPSMSDLLARLKQDLLEVSLAGGAHGRGGGGGGNNSNNSGANDSNGGNSGFLLTPVLRYIPVGQTRSAVTFQWCGVAKKEVRLVMEGWGTEEVMQADQETQSFFLVHHLPAGRYTYRYKVDGYYLLDPKAPTAGALGTAGFDDPALMRNLVIVVPHTTEPSLDATRKPLATVDLPQKSLGDDGVWVLKQALLRNRAVTVLNLPSNAISTDGCCALGGLLAERPAMLKRLNLGSNGMGYEGCVALAMGLQRNHSLTSLEMPRCRVGDDGADALAKGLEGHRCLLNLELGGNFIHCDGLEDLCRSLVKNNSLVRLGLSHNCLAPRGIRAACAMLVVNQRLVEVDFTNNPKIGPRGAVELGGLLTSPDCALESLGLSGCSLMVEIQDDVDDDTEGAKATAAAARAGGVLYGGSMEVGGGGSGGVMDEGDGAPKDGLYRLALGISRNEKLRSLTLANNGINNWGARELAVAMQENTSVVSCDLGSNVFADEWVLPVHTLHTDIDPSLRSIASSVLRNGELFVGGATDAERAKRKAKQQAESEKKSNNNNNNNNHNASGFGGNGGGGGGGSGSEGYAGGGGNNRFAIPLGARLWDTAVGAPGMVVRSYNRGDQDGAMKRRRKARRLERERRNKAEKGRMRNEAALVRGGGFGAGLKGGRGCGGVSGGGGGSIAGSSRSGGGKRGGVPQIQMPESLFEDLGPEEGGNEYSVPPTANNNSNHNTDGGNDGNSYPGDSDFSSESSESEEEEDEAALAEAAFIDGEERNFVGRDVTDPLDVVAQALRRMRKEQKLAGGGELGFKNEHGVWRDEGSWVPRTGGAGVGGGGVGSGSVNGGSQHPDDDDGPSMMPPPPPPYMETSGSAVGGQQSFSLSVGPRWVSKAQALKEEAAKQELLDRASEKNRIKDENAFIEAALEVALGEVDLFVAGVPCSLEHVRGVGYRLVQALATSVLGRDKKEREKMRSRRLKAMAAAQKSNGGDKDAAYKVKRDTANKFKKEDLLELFDSYDADCSGQLDRTELGTVVKALGLTLTEAELDGLCDKLDTDGGGEVGFEEFFAWQRKGGMEELLARGSQSRALLMEASNFLAQGFGNWNLGAMLKAGGGGGGGGGAGSEGAGGGGLGGSNEQANRKVGEHAPVRVGGDGASLSLRAVRCWRSVLMHQAEKRSRAEFRKVRPPRRGCVCPATGFSFPDAPALSTHQKVFDFDAFYLRQRKFAARERLSERAREAINAVPEFPAVVAFNEKVPQFVELTAYDVADQRLGRPIGVVRNSDVVRAIGKKEARTEKEFAKQPWLKILLPSAPDGAWVLNRSGRYTDILQPLAIGARPGEDDDDAAEAYDPYDSDDDSDDDDDVEGGGGGGGDGAGGAGGSSRSSTPKTPKTPSELKQHTQAKRKKALAAKKRLLAKAKADKAAKKKQEEAAAGGSGSRAPRVSMLWFDTGDALAQEAWFRCEPRLPVGASLKIRTRPLDDAEVVGTLREGYGVRAVCTAKDWLMVQYTVAPTMQLGDDPAGTLASLGKEDQETTAEGGGSGGGGGGGCKSPGGSGNSDGAAAAAPLLKKEGWMLMRTAIRILLVPVSDPYVLQELTHSEVSPAPLPDPATIPGALQEEGESSDEEVEMSVEQMKELRRVKKEMQKKKKSLEKKAR